MTASREAIAHHFIYRVLPEPKWRGWNWGCHPRIRDDDGLCFWDVDCDTYINGVMLTMDADYHMGYLLEMCERDTSVVSYVAIAVFHGPHRETGKQDHDSEWYAPVCGTFFDRTPEADHVVVCRWAVGALDSMMTSYRELRR